MEESRMADSLTAEDDRRRRLVKLLPQLLGICVIVAALIVSVIAFFRLKICDDHPLSDGTTVQVCRHVETTDPPAIAMALVIVFATGLLFKFTEFSALG